MIFIKKVVLKLNCMTLVNTQSYETSKYKLFNLVISFLLQTFITGYYQFCRKTWGLKI